MEQQSIKIINKYQQQVYSDFEKETAQKLVELYSPILQKVKSCNSLKIIDIGGGAGFFALALYDFFVDKKCEIYVLDSSEYPTWATHSEKITFVKESADNLSKLFAENTFDLVFANRVFHHFVRDSWKNSKKGMANIMQQISHILKKDGQLCIVDHIYNGFLYENATSKIIYALTSIRNPILAAIFRKFGANTAGIGVCFLSKKMWMHLFKYAGLQLHSFIENLECNPLALYKNILFLCKKSRLDNVFVCKK